MLKRTHKLWFAAMENGEPEFSSFILHAVCMKYLTVEGLWDTSSTSCETIY